MSHVNPYWLTVRMPASREPRCSVAAGIHVSGPIHIPSRFGERNVNCDWKMISANGEAGPLRWLVSLLLDFTRLLAPRLRVNKTTSSN
jgi:hypothetical protein